MGRVALVQDDAGVARREAAQFLAEDHGVRGALAVQVDDVVDAIRGPRASGAST